MPITVFTCSKITFGIRDFVWHGLSVGNLIMLHQQYVLCTLGVLTPEVATDYLQIFHHSPRLTLTQIPLRIADVTAQTRTRHIPNTIKWEAFPLETTSPVLIRVTYPLNQKSGDSLTSHLTVPSQVESVQYLSLRCRSRRMKIRRRREMGVRTSNSIVCPILKTAMPNSYITPRN